MNMTRSSLVPLAIASSPLHISPTSYKTIYHMKVICTVQHEGKKAENKLNMACSLDCDKEEVERGLYTVQV